MRELTLKYVIQLASNIGQKSEAEAKLLEQAQKRMQEATQATSKDTDKLIDKVGKSSKDVSTLNSKLTELGNNSSLRRQIDYVDRLSGSLERAAQRYTQMAAAAAEAAMRHGPEIAAGATAAGYAVSKPLRAYANLEQAQTDLRVAMMDRTGGVSKYYGAISKEALSLGNQLPGTTKDFTMGALALKANGTPDDVIANGGLRSSSYLGVLLHMQQEQSAEMVAKARESYALSGEQLIPAADRIQRARFGLGIKPEEITAANTYMANTLNTVGWTGLGNMNQVLAMQGMGQQQGMAGSVFGTNMKDFIQRLALADTRLDKKSKEAKHVRGLMRSAGINRFEVFGADGQMVSPLEVTRQMEQFNKLKPQDRLEAFHNIFGDQGGQIAQLLSQKGVAGLREKMSIMDGQADLNTRLAETTKTLTNTFDALTGTAENVAAKAAQPLGDAIKHPINSVNDWLGGPVSDMLDSHPKMGTAGIGLMGMGTFMAGTSAFNSLRGMLAARGIGSAATVGAAELGLMGAGSMMPGFAGMARFANAARMTGVGALFGAGLDTVSVLSDPTLTDAGRTRGLWRAGATNGSAALAGAAAGAALGSVVPVLGTGLGAVAGGALGYLGAGAAFDSLWKPDAKRDYLTVTAPNGSTVAGGNGGATVQLGEGRLQVDVRVSDDRITSSSTVTQPLPLIKINPGATNPGGF